MSSLLLRAAVLPLLGAFVHAQAAELPSQAELGRLSLEELLEIPVETVYGASKELQNTLAAPSSVTVVDSATIEEHGYRTLSALLREVRGFYVTNDRNYERLGIRGLAPPGDYNGRALLLVDGHRVNDAVYGSASIGLEFPLDVDLIQRVEVIRGPGSSLYGSNAFLGVIDVRTKRGADVGGLELSGEAGSFGTQRARATWGRVLANGDDLLLSGSVFTRDGPRLVYDEFSGTPGGGVTHDTDYEQGYSFFSQLVHGPFTLQGAYVSREKGIPTGSFGTVFDDPANRTLDQRGWLALSGEHREGERWELRGRLAYDAYYYGGTYVYDETATGGAPDVHNHDKAWGRWWSGELELVLLTLPDQRVTLGSEYRGELRKDQSNYDTAIFLDDQRTGHAAGVYAQDEVRLSEALTLDAGLRADHYDTFGSTTNPRLALILQPDDESAWKLLFGTAFRPPNAYELYYGDGSTQEANPDLEPETIRTLEGIHERFFGGRTWRFASSVYSNRIERLIVQQVDPNNGLLVFENAADARGIGLELKLEHSMDCGARWHVGHAWQRTEDVKSGERLVNSPEHILQVGLDAALGDERVRLGADLLAMDHRRTLAGETGGFAQLDLSLSARELVHGLFASLSLTNALDSRHSDPVGPELVQDALQQDGRALLLRVAWHP